MTRRKEKRGGGTLIPKKHGCPKENTKDITINPLVKIKIIN